MHQRPVLINISAMRANPAVGRDREPGFAFCEFLTWLHIRGLPGCRPEGASLFRWRRDFCLRDEMIVL